MKKEKQEKIDVLTSKTKEIASSMNVDADKVIYNLEDYNLESLEEYKDVERLMLKEQFDELIKDLENHKAGDIYILADVEDVKNQIIEAVTENL